jgi:septal ring factor EnvC (AmiA/AmiB activator)
MRGKAIFSITWIVKPQFSQSFLRQRTQRWRIAVRRIRPRGRSRPAKSIQADIAAKERAVRQQQQQRAACSPSSKQQEEAISAAAQTARNAEHPAQLNKQIDEMNASIAKLERQRAQERNLAAQLDAAFRQGEHTGIQMILSGEESQRGQRLQAYFGYLNQARQETIAQLKQTREEVATQKPSWKRSRASSRRWSTNSRPSRQSWSRRATSVKNPFALESSIQQGQQQLSEMRANESRLRGSIARAEAAKARADRKLARRRPCATSRKHPQRHHLQTNRKRTFADVAYRRPGLSARSGFLARSRFNSASLWRTAAG